MDPGLVASAGPRYYGFVIGGALPAAAAADWLTTAWGQNAALHALSPAAAAAEAVAGAWMLELLGLPREASFGLPTGAGLGNTVGLAAARHALLERAGWDVEARGLYGAPEITVPIGADAHATLLTALQYLGLGRDRVVRVEADDQGRMRLDAGLAAAADAAGAPLIVATQAGNVNSGAVDPIGEIAAALEGHPNAWVHVDGAFGLWAAVSPSLRAPRGRCRARRLVVDRRAQVAERRVRLRLRRGARPGRASRRDGHRCLLPHAERPARELGVRARQLASGARLRPPTRRSARWAEAGSRRWSSAAARSPRRIADRLRAADGVEVLNDVVLNQVLVRFGDDDARTKARHRCCPGRWDGVDGRDHLAGTRGDADQRQQLVDHRGGCGSHRRGDPALRRRLEPQARGYLLNPAPGAARPIRRAARRSRPDPGDEPLRG